MDLKSTDRRALAAALLAVLLGALDLTVIATILPGMVTDLRINAADVDRYVWIVNSYLLAYVVAIPVVGRLSDIVGRTLAFQGSLALFLVGSIVCAFATDLPAMVAGRAIQGAGGGALLPVTMAMVGDLLPPGRRAAALGLVGAVDTLGWVARAALGRLAGGDRAGSGSLALGIHRQHPARHCGRHGHWSRRRRETACSDGAGSAGWMCRGRFSSPGRCSRSTWRCRPGASSGRQPEERARSAVRAIPSPSSCFLCWQSRSCSGCSLCGGNVTPNGRFSQ